MTAPMGLSGPGAGPGDGFGDGPGDGFGSGPGDGLGDGPGDAELVAGALAGDRDAFAALYERYADRLHDFCYSVLRDRHEAADAMQDTFVVAVERLGQLRDPQRLRPWLYAIARSQALRRIRSRSRLAPEAEAGEMADPGTGPAEAAEQAALRDLVWNAAAGLSDRDRVLLDLHLRQGLDGAELGEAMGTNASHAYVLLTRLRDQVERSLGALLIARLGRRDCTELDRVLAGWDGRFSPLIRKRVARHVDACSICAERRSRVVSPWALLSTVPLVPAPPALRDEVLDRVELVAGRRPAASRGPGPRAMAGVAAVLVVGAGTMTSSTLLGPSLSPAAAPPVIAVTASAAPSAGSSAGHSAGPSAGASAATSAGPVSASPQPGAGAGPGTGPGAGTGPPSPAPPELQLSTRNLDLGSRATSGTVVLTNAGGQELTWTATPSAGWLSADPAGGAIPGGGSAPLVLRADRSAVSSSAARAAVHISWEGGTVPVWVTISQSRQPERDDPPTATTRGERRAQDPATPTGPGR